MAIDRRATLCGLGGVTLVWVSGCGGGGDSGGDSPSLPGGPGCQATTISANHNHVLAIPDSALDATTNQTFTTTGLTDHTHSITLTPAQLADLKAKKSVTVTSTSDPSNAYGPHSHSVTLQCL